MSSGAPNERPSVLKRLEERKRREADFAPEWERACERGRAFSEAFRPIEWYGRRDISGKELPVNYTTCTLKGWEKEWIQLGKFLNSRPDIREAVLAVLDERKAHPS